MKNPLKITNQPGSEPLYTLSVVSRLSGTPDHSILQYINKGLIIPYKKDSKRNLFSDGDVSRLMYIRHLLEEKGLNIAGIKALMSLIPCWAINKCSDEDKEHCEAYNSSFNPCWEASEKGTKCKNTECRQCDVYNFTQDNKDLKQLFRQLIN